VLVLCTPGALQRDVVRCYTCGKEGYFAKECTAGAVTPEVVLVHDNSYKDSGLPVSESEEELELEEPGKEQP
jgi:hypothetical protein